MALIIKYKAINQAGLFGGRKTATHGKLLVNKTNKARIKIIIQYEQSKNTFSNHYNVRTMKDMFAVPNRGFYNLEK